MEGTGVLGGKPTEKKKEWFLESSCIGCSVERVSITNIVGLKIVSQTGIIRTSLNVKVVSSSVDIPVTVHES